ncbi:cytochrome P450 18a1 [Trichonephila inaurata madagascariensis]|uniref:Cytochrome P450 18a1 n=1 Tax=Trichonephila inaurata madagascariensis TaxID=2747483 RepID=A0A8X7BWW0_9ARAC|nr:cytochrome P450 18a1 [Trichonephila inaurata madagascariensis]
MFESLLKVKNEVWIAVFVTFLVYIIGYLIRRFRLKFPPGPTGLPVVGYLPFLSKDVHLKFIELAKKYGDVFSMRLGSVPVVVLNDTASIREAFTKPECLGRPPHSSFSVFGVQSPFFMSDMHMWQEQRRFVVHTLKDLGLGRSKIEEQMLDEIAHFCNVLKSHEGKPMDVIVPLTPSISNNICSLIFGKRYGYQEPERIALDTNLGEVGKIIGQTAAHIFFPWIKYIPFLMKLLDYEKGSLLFRNSEEIFIKKINEHKDTLDPKNIRDYMDRYLIEMEIRKKKDPDTTFTDATLMGSVGDLFGAGSETGRTSISWCLYIVAAYPDVQRKIQEEIMDVLGAERSPEFLDQKSMPFTHAVILEVMRWKSIVPINVLRYTLANTSISGYDIPQGTTIMANFWAVHHDPRNWEDPDTFKPERFLSPDGKSVVKSPSYMPFSVGKRACPGETMAYMQIFLYFVYILQKFDLRFPEGVKPDFEGNLTITFAPKPFKIRFIPRN